MDRHGRRRRGGDAGEPADRRLVLPAARPLFTIATIATAQALMLIFLKFRDLAWGAEGTTIPNLGKAPLMMQFEARRPITMSRSACSRSGSGSPGASENSWMGYYLVAIGEDEDAAEAIGVNAPKIKRDIYLISAFLFLTALAGTFYTQYILLHRSGDRVQLQTSRSRPRWCRSSVASARCGARLIGTIPVGNHLDAVAELARRLVRRRAADGLRPDLDDGDPVAADRADRPLERVFGRLVRRPAPAQA